MSSPFTISSRYANIFHLPVSLKNGNRNFMGNYIPNSQPNEYGLKLFLNNTRYSATSSALGNVGTTSLGSRAVRRR